MPARDRLGRVDLSDLRQQVGALLAQRGLLLVDAPDLLASGFLDLAAQGPQRGLGLADGEPQAASAGMRRRVWEIRLLGPIHPGEHRLQRVVVRLLDRVELVVVAAGAVDREARERRHGCSHHVVAVKQARQLLVLRALAQFSVPDVVPRACRHESRRDQAIRIARPEDIPGNLFADEAGVGLVPVEALDHVVAIRPRVAPRLVLVVAVRLAVVRHIQPVPPPALPVARRGEQAVHQALIGVWRAVAYKRVDFCWRRRQAVEVEAEPANERGAVRLPRWAESLLGEHRGDKAIDLVRAPGRRWLGHRGPHEFAERPPSRIPRLVAHRALRRAGGDPTLQQSDLRRRERRADRRHLGALA